MKINHLWLRRFALRKLLLLFGVFVASAPVALAQLVLNDSFEDDTFTVPPGYIHQNGPITGWTAIGTVGINPAKGLSPFANNGSVIFGKQVAFLQNESVLKQTISGFEIGSQYDVWYYENARSGNFPILAVTVGDLIVVQAHVVVQVDPGHPYRQVKSLPFTATAETLDLTFSNTAAPDNTVLIDNVSISKVNGPLSEEVSPGQLLVYESFDYVEGSKLNEIQAGGFGWRGKYELDRGLTNFASAIVTASSLAHVNLSTAGNKITTGKSCSLRYLDLTAFPPALVDRDNKTIHAENKAIWLSVLARRDAKEGEGFFGLSLFQDDEEVLFLGSGRDERRWRIGGGGGTIGLVERDATETALLVVRIDWNDGSYLHPAMAYLWVNPDTRRQTLERSTALAVSKRPDGYAFSRVGFRGLARGSLDELRIGTSFRSVVPTME